MRYGASVPSWALFLDNARSRILFLGYFILLIKISGQGRIINELNYAQSLYSGFVYFIFCGLSVPYIYQDNDSTSEDCLRGLKVA